jgi:plastocyanin
MEIASVRAVLTKRNSEGISMSGIIRIGSASLIIALAACSGSTGTYGNGGNGGGNQNPPPPANTIEARPNLSFSPTTLTTDAGQTVTFAIGSVAHNVIFENRTAATPADIAGSNSNISVQRTFSTPGTYAFHCNIHPFMTGSVVVR